MITSTTVEKVGDRKEKGDRIGEGDRKEKGNRGMKAYGLQMVFRHPQAVFLLDLYEAVGKSNQGLVVDSQIEVLTVVETSGA